MSSNSNLPSLKVWVHNSFLYQDNRLGSSEGFLVSVRSLSNQSFQFTVLLRNGALYTGLPCNAISFSSDSFQLPLSESILWDSISSSIEIFTLDLLRYMSCTVKTRSGAILEANYMFTIDCVGNDLSRDAENWKQYHILKAKDGQMLIYPQYRIKFTDKGLCDETFPLPDKHNVITWVVE